MEIKEFLKRFSLTLMLLVTGALITGCALAIDLVLQRFMVSSTWRGSAQIILLGIGAMIMLFSAKLLVFRFFGGPPAKPVNLWRGLTFRGSVPDERQLAAQEKESLEDTTAK